MDLETFRRRAREIVEEIPPEYMEGITGVEVHDEAVRQGHIPGVFTLGMCESDPLHLMTEPEALRSRVHLYHGSFAAIARRDRGFDWEAELRETILHEVRHHLEDRAGLPDLRDEDALEDALRRFDAGEELPQGWWRHGERMERDVWRVGDDLFVELRLRAPDLARMRGGAARMLLLGEPFEPWIPEDAEPGDVLTFPGEGLVPEIGETGRPGAVHLVLDVHTGHD